jgi:hypothetical protein
MPLQHTWGAGSLSPQLLHSNFCKMTVRFYWGAMKANNLSPLPFQAHLKWAHDLLPPIGQISI